MKLIFSCALLIFCLNALAQNDSTKAVADVLAFQKTLNNEYKSKKESPLEPADLRKFKGHPFFPIDITYRVKAKLEVTAGTPFLQLKTTTDRLTTDRIYGYLVFTLREKEYRIPVYQSERLMGTKEYADYLFFPFSDLTNGKETYDGGRYIDLRIPVGTDEIVVDFNKAYNPYCAYNHKYSCPLVPEANQMDIRIPVGTMYTHKK